MNKVTNNKNEKTSLGNLFEKIKDYPTLNEKEEKEIASMVKNGDKSARERLYLSNLRFVFFIASRYQNKGLSMDELFQEGCVGLMSAVDKFDVDKNYKFSSYSVWWIKQAIQSAIVENRHNIRLPLNKNNDYVKLEKAREELLKEDPSHEPSLDELAERSSLKVKDIKILKNARREVKSLDEKIIRKDEEDGNTFGENLKDSNINVEEESMSKAMSEDIDTLMRSVLSERERGIIRMYYGFDTGKESSYQKVGDAFGLTKERIRQILNTAKDKLKKAGDMIGLWDYYTLAC